jgi:hypothetical protein
MPANPVSPKTAKVAPLFVTIFRDFVSCVATTVSCIAFLDSVYVSNGEGQNRHVRTALVIFTQSGFAWTWGAMRFGWSGGSAGP